MQMIKYKENLIYKIIHKIKGLFARETDSITSIQTEPIIEEPKKEIDYEAITGCKKYNPKEETIQSISKFENDQSIVKDLTNEQIKELIEYYQEKNKELKREYEYKRTKFNNLAKKLIDAHEKDKNNNNVNKIIDYAEIKEKFYSSNYARQIVDKWGTGIPFFMNYENEICDAFLFYSDNREMSCFHSIKMLVIVNSLTGEIKCLTDKIETFKVANEFLFRAKTYSNIDEYITLGNRLQEAYIEVRNNFALTNHIDTTLQKQYFDLIVQLIPSEIIENVYKPLSPELFGT